MSWLRRQAKPHGCRVPKGSHVPGDIWKCDDCDAEWTYWRNWAGDGWDRTWDRTWGFA